MDDADPSVCNTMAFPYATFSCNRCNHQLNLCYQDIFWLINDGILKCEFCDSRLGVDEPSRRALGRQVAKKSRQDRVITAFLIPYLLVLAIVAFLWGGLAVIFLSGMGTLGFLLLKAIFRPERNQQYRLISQARW